MRARLPRTSPLLAAALVLAACGQPSEVDVSPALQTGYWRATIQLPGGEIDTGFELTREDGVWQAHLINGQERVRIDEVRYEYRELTLRFPAFNNHITARLADGRLIGTLTIVERYGERMVMPLAASPGIERTAPREPGVDMSGRWAVRFHNEDGSDTPSVGEFAQRGGRLFGTFLNPSGDHRYLSGYVNGNQFKLSTFDGAHAYIFAGEVDDNRINRASFWSGTNSHQNWSGERNADIVLPDTFSRTFLNPLRSC